MAKRIYFSRFTSKLKILACRSSNVLDVTSKPKFKKFLFSLPSTFIRQREPLANCFCFIAVYLVTSLKDNLYSSCLFHASFSLTAHVLIGKD